jgi:hypothetical protein
MGVGMVMAGVYEACMEYNGENFLHGNKFKL